MTRWPRLARALGKAPMTSPRPPVFDQGAHSLPTMTTFITFCPARGSFFTGAGGVAASADIDLGCLGTAVSAGDMAGKVRL